MAFYNTTHEDGQTLIAFEDKNFTQEGIVEGIFKQYPEKQFTPSQILKTYFDRRVPLTSIRRAISDLTEKGRLSKTDEKRVGMYGRPETCWKLSKKEAN